MTKIRIEKKACATLPKKYVRLTFTNDKSDFHRFVESSDGTSHYKMGVGASKDLTPRKFITAIRSAIQSCKRHHIPYVALELDLDAFPKVSKKGSQWAFRTLTENLLIAAYSFDKYKSKKNDAHELKEIVVCGVHTKSDSEACTRGIVVAQSVNLTRDIANTTAEEMTPTQLGKEAQKALRGTAATVRVLGEKELKKLQMNLLLAVGQGTVSETKLILIEYWGAGKNKSEKPIVLVGKGVTYDTGGLNVKPSGSMHEMHLDMSGGSSVIGALSCAAKLKLKKNIIGIIPAAENAVSDRSMRAGDIVRSKSGKTVEIVHTDAEGRLILADALTYAQKYEPRVVLDMATLTGAALVALGQHASAIMTNDQKLESTLRELGEESGDYVWPLPLWEEYKQHIKSDRADVANIAPNFSRFGGTIEGGTFLSYFAPTSCPWAHIDIAPRMNSIPSDKLAKGSTGEPVRLLVRFVESY